MVFIYLCVCPYLIGICETDLNDSSSTMITCLLSKRTQVMPHISFFLVNSSKIMPNISHIKYIHVCINFSSPRGFTAMLEYFYHGHIIVERDSIEDVLEAARFFHIEWLLQVRILFRSNEENANFVLKL